MSNYPQASLCKRNKSGLSIASILTGQRREMFLLNAMQQALLESGLSQDEVARQMGKKQSWLNVQINGGGNFQPAIFTIDRFSEVNDTDVVIAALAHNRGCVLVHIPTDFPGGTDVANQIANTSLENAQVIAATVKAIADGTITQAEYDRIHQQIVENEQALAALDELLQAKVARSNRA